MLTSAAPLSVVMSLFSKRKQGKRGRSGGQDWKGYSRGDSMIWDFVGRRPLPARDYVVSIMGGPKLWNHVSKVWRLLVWRNKTDEKFDEIKVWRVHVWQNYNEKTYFHVHFFIGLIPSRKESPNFWHVISQLGTAHYWKFQFEAT